MYKTWAHALHVKSNILQILNIITGEYLYEFGQRKDLLYVLDCHNKISWTG